MAFGAAFTGLCTVAALAGGVPPALADLGAQLTFVCAAPSGTHKVKASVIGASPLSGTAGEPITFGKITLGLVVPVALLEEKPGGRPAGVEPTAAPGQAAAGVSGGARLAVTVTQKGRSSDAGWSDFRFDTGPAPAIEDGGLSLSGTATAPSLLPSAPGDLVWTVRGLTLALGRGDGEVPREVTCAAEGDGVLGRLDVAEAGPSASASRNVPSATPAAGGLSGDDTWCEIIPGPDGEEYGFNQDPRLKLWAEDGVLDGEYPPYVPGFGGDPSRFRLVTSDGIANCIRASGFTTVKKLGVSAPVAAETLLRRGIEGFVPLPPITPENNYFQQRSYSLVKAAQSTGVALGFGFMPTTATTSIRQVAPPGSGPDGRRVGNFRADLTSNTRLPGPPWFEGNYGSTRSFVDVKLEQAQVNGVQLSLGDECTSAPTVLFLESDLGDIRRGSVDIAQGSTFTGEVDIPKFTGCGVEEDLSPLLSATVSGDGNKVKIDTGVWCGIPLGQDPGQCDATNEYEPATYTIKPGGKWVMEAKPFIIPGNAGSSVVCDSFSLGFDLPKEHWVSRLHVATTTDIDLAGCELRTPEQTMPVQVANIGGITLSIEGPDPRVEGNISFDMSGIVLDVGVERNDVKCSLRLGNKVIYIDRGIKYADAPATTNLSIPNGGETTTSRIGLMVQDASTCTDIPGFPRGGRGAHFSSPTFHLDPRQTFIRSW